MKAWLKGGIIGGSIGLIIRIIAFIFEGMFLWKIQEFLMPFYYDSSAPFFGLVPSFGGGYNTLLQYLLSTLVFIIYLFILGGLIGILIGWIIGKIKNKKNKEW